MVDPPVAPAVATPAPLDPCKGRLACYSGDLVSLWPKLRVRTGYQFVEADPEILKDLKARKLVLKTETIKHDYPFCWRCGAYLIYFARETWYLRTTQFKEEMQRENAKIRWVPEEMGEGRFGRDRLSLGQFQLGQVQPGQSLPQVGGGRVLDGA